MLPAESVTEVTWLVAPVYSLTETTSRSPALVADGKEPLSEVDVVVSVADAVCTRAGAAVVTGLTVREKLVEWVADVPVPVTVMLVVPVGVVDDVVTVMVELCPALTVCGLNDTRAPVGIPVALSATDWVDPLVTAVPMVDVAGEPAITVAELGVAEMEKSFGGGGLTVREKLVEWVADVPVPVTVMLVVPVGVVDDVVTVMVELCPALTVCGLNDTRAPVGIPVALSATDWVDPLVTAVPMVDVAGEPAVTVAELGLAEMEKSFEAAGFTVKVKLWLAGVPIPLVAVMVMG